MLLPFYYISSVLSNNGQNFEMCNRRTESLLEKTSQWTNHGLLAGISGNKSSSLKSDLIHEKIEKHCDFTSDCHKSTLKKAAFTPSRLPTCHLKRHQRGRDKLTREASASCLLARQPCHLILLRKPGGLDPALTLRAERAPDATLHLDTRDIVTLLDQMRHRMKDFCQ